ncbi:MAG TPA: ANTAR domain-containing protein [Acidocella sp.]|nr:ANTAR domain-containing protein [Acidocella sp.]
MDDGWPANCSLPHHDSEASVKILVADRDGRYAGELLTQLKALDDAFTVILAAEGENLLDAVRRLAPDVVIVDMARPDRDGLDSVRALNAQQMLPVVMFVDVDDPAFMEEAIAAGVSSYHVGGVAVPAIKPILRAATAVFQRMRGLRDRLYEAEEQIEARQAIEAAKRLLMVQDKMSEPAAHRFLQRRAMDQQKKLAEVAASLLRDRKNSREIGGA